MADRFACSFKATELDARQGILEVVSRLGEFRIPAPRVDDVQIALAEAVNNVVEHAYSGREGGTILVECSLQDTLLLVEIQDAGHPFPGGKLPEGRPARLPEKREDLPEGGFGWYLIRELASDIKYNRVMDNNQLSLSFRIDSSVA